jgi:hypothetical protein
MAASVRVEKLKYKEILTPTWRLLEEEQQLVTSLPVSLNHTKWNKLAEFVLV